MEESKCMDCGEPATKERPLVSLTVSAKGKAQSLAYCQDCAPKHRKGEA